MAQLTSADWTAESAYWRDNFRTRPYIKADEFRDFGYYEPAYPLRISQSLSREILG